MRTYIENYLHFMKNCIRPHYEKLKPLRSGFIENSNFENNRDPWSKTDLLNKFLGYSRQWKQNILFFWISNIICLTSARTASRRPARSKPNPRPRRSSWFSLDIRSLCRKYLKQLILCLLSMWCIVLSMHMLLKTRCQIWCTIEAHRDPISKVLSEW